MELQFIIHQNRVLGAAAEDRNWAISSVGERFPHTEEVTGSIPVSPTTSQISRTKDLRENNLNNFAPRFGLDLDGTIEKNTRHSTAMVRVFRLRPVQRWPEDWMRD